MSAAGLTIKELYRRKSSAIARRPSFARGRGQARVRMRAGYACAVEHEDRTEVVDQPESEGGGGAGPHPGQLMRASLGACLAMGYRSWAARLDVDIEAVDVDIVCEYDARGQMGLSSEVPIGWERIRFEVVITSNGAEDELRHVVDVADRLSPMLANLSPTITRTRQLTIVRPQKG